MWKVILFFFLNQEIYKALNLQRCSFLLRFTIDYTILYNTFEKPLFNSVSTANFSLHQILANTTHW